MQHTGTAAPLLERTAELRGLHEAVEDARAGRGRVVLVEGPPGIGKTRLLGSGGEGARERGMVVLAARASELDRDFPFGVVRQLFEPLVADEARRARSLHGAAERAVALLIGDSRPAARAAADADPSWAHFHALYWLVANLAEQAPAALLIDDLHWADTSSLRFLQFLVPRLEELAVVLVATARPAAPGGDRTAIDALATDPLTLVLRPPPLSDDAVATLVTAQLGDRADAGFCTACREATGGNPFLLSELLRELAADDIAPTRGQAPIVRELAPPAVARAVLLRLARLGPDAPALARAVAVLGDGTTVRRASSLAGLADERADVVADALARADILAADRPLAFAHPILRSAVYADIAPGERGRAHRCAAALLSGEGATIDEIAVHLLATEPAEDPETVATLREAAARDLARGAAATAAACLRRALAEPPAADERGPLMLELAEAEMAAGEPAAAAEHFEAGLRITEDVRIRAGCAGPLVAALQALDRHAEAFAALEGLVRDTATAGAPELSLSLEADLIASASLQRSRRAWALERLESYRGRLTADTAGERKLLATIAALDAFSSTCDTPGTALADAAERAVAGGRMLDDGQSTAFYFAIVVLALADRTEHARRLLDRAVDDARREGSAPGFAFAAGWRCWLLAREGRLSDAEADARSCAELSVAQGWFLRAPVILGYVLDVLIERGQVDDAHRLLDQSGMASRGGERDATFDDVVHARARLAAERGDLAAARAGLAQLARRRARWNTYPTLVPAILAAPQLTAGEDRDDARSRAERMLGEANAWGTPRAIGMALRALGLLEGGPRGLERLAEACEVLERSPARLEHARALADLGAALRRANRRAAARDPLRRALDLADACGAGPLADRARHELLAAGARPRRPRLSGVDALTASERRIAAMAADGLSNPEIAQALFVTTKTVEAHLSNAYRKLDIRSRTQLPRALESTPG